MKVHAMITNNKICANMMKLSNIRNSTPMQNMSSSYAPTKHEDLWGATKIISDTHSSQPSELIFTNRYALLPVFLKNTAGG